MSTWNQDPAGQPQSSYPQSSYPSAPPVAAGAYTDPAGQSAAQLSLIFGILGVVLLPIVFGPLALWQAKKAESYGVKATAGKVLGWVAIVLAILAILGLILFFVLAAGSGIATAGY